MAALMRHGMFETSLRYNFAQNLCKTYATKQRKPNIDKKKTPKIDSVRESLAEKGFLRAQNSYSPPVDLAERFKSLCITIFGSESLQFNNNNKKYELLNACRQEFNHSVPSSLLHTLENTNDVLKFYKKHISTNTPLDAMKTMELPGNLHIEFDYHRFHPETDTMFNGVTAFPRSSTLVTGITYRKKYVGHKANQTWPYNT